MAPTDVPVTAGPVLANQSLQPRTGVPSPDQARPTALPYEMLWVMESGSELSASNANPAPALRNVVLSRIRAV